jgi:hypothetical protein
VKAPLPLRVENEKQPHRYPWGKPLSRGSN